MKRKTGGSSGESCLLVFFFGIFALSGTLASYFMGIKPIYKIAQARSWQETHCWITYSDLDESQTSEGTSYSVDIEYVYEYAGAEYEGNRYRFGLGSGDYEDNEAVVDHYPVDLQTTCFVNPADPSESVLLRGGGSYLWWGLFGVPFMVVGYGGLMFIVIAHRRNKNDSPHKPRPVNPRLRDGVVLKAGRETLIRDENTTATRGPRKLDPKRGTKGRFFGALIGAVFWNGITWAILLTFLSSGDFSIFLYLFFSIFVLIGLALVVSAVYFFLALFNPSPHLVVDLAGLVPGGRSRLKWYLEGKAQRCQAFKISLIGQEVASYRRGTNNHTDTQTFYEAALLELGAGSNFQKGSTMMEIPRKAMPSFKARNNRIEWLLRVHGDIPRWPDIRYDFPISVRAEKAP